MKHDSANEQEKNSLKNTLLEKERNEKILDLTKLTMEVSDWLSLVWT